MNTIKAFFQIIISQFFQFLKQARGDFIGFNIFLVVPNFAKILTTVKIVKKTHAGKEGLIFGGLEAAIWKFDKISGSR